MSEWYPSAYWSHWQTASGAQVRQTEPEPSRFNFLSFLASAQALNLEFLPIVHDMQQDLVGLGGTSRIQEALIDEDLSFAFKIYQNRGATEEKVFRSLINELAVSRQMFVRGHPNIIQLRGIAWDISPVDDKPWPVLVYEKSHWGDLHHFVRHEGKEMTMKQRLEICVDIGRAIMDMYSNRIVHGDIKPDNVLIFKDTPQKLRAKVIDFGYSSHYMDDGQSLSLAISEPWNAPENDDLQREWSFSQAAAADLFCFGMLCFWLLFEPRISEEMGRQRDSEATAINFVARVEDSLHTMKAELKSHAHRFLSLEADLTRNEKVFLAEFFDSSLSHAPDERQMSLSTFLEKMDTDMQRSIPQEVTAAIGERRSIPQSTTLSSTGSDTPYTEFKIQQSIFEFYQTDYRVRVRIAQDLLNNAPQSSATAIQSALCYYIGFGVTRDETRCREILDQNNQDFQHIQDIVAVLRQQCSELSVSSMVKTRSAPHYPRSDMIHIYFDQGKVKQAEERIRQEIIDLSIAFGSNHVLTALANDMLAGISFMQGKFDDAEKALMQNIETRKIVFGPDAISTLETMVDLSIVYWTLDLVEEAEDLLRKVIEGYKIKLGPNDPTTLDTMDFLAIILRRTRKSESEKLELQVIETRMASLEADHTGILNCLHELSDFYSRQRQWKKAEEIQKRILETTRKKLGPNHLNTTLCAYTLVSIYMRQDQWAEAEKLGEQVLMKFRKAGHEPDDGHTWASMARLGLIYRAQGKQEEAEELLKPVRDIYQKKMQETTRYMKDSLYDMSGILTEFKRLNEEVPSGRIP